jgi:hypothetical protein
MATDPRAPLFPPAWFAAGVVSPAGAADFARYAAADPARSNRYWRWAAFRDWVEERGRLTADECRAAYRLGETDPDPNLGTALMCSVLYQPGCPAEVRAAAAASDRRAVRRTAGLFRPDRGARWPSG